MREHGDQKHEVESLVAVGEYQLRGSPSRGPGPAQFFVHTVRSLDELKIEIGKEWRDVSSAPVNTEGDDVESVVRRFKSVRLLHESKVGSYAARNRGLRQASGSYVAFTDADCRPHEDWIDQAILQMAEAPNCLYLAGKNVPGFRDPDRLTAAEIYQKTHAGRGREHLVDFGFGPTCNLVVRAEIFDLVGTFDDSVRSGGDFQWGRKVRDRGIEQIYCEDVIVVNQTRHRLRDLAHQEARKFDGIYQMFRKSDPTVLGLVRTFLFGFFGTPGWHRLTRDRFRTLLANRELARYLFAAEILRWVRAREFFRMLLGGTPQRT